MSLTVTTFKNVSGTIFQDETLNSISLSFRVVLFSVIETLKTTFYMSTKVILTQTAVRKVHSL